MGSSDIRDHVVGHHSVAMADAGSSIASATMRMKPAAVPPSHTRWSNTKLIWVILRTHSWPSDHPRPVDDPAEAEDRDLRVVDDGGAAVDPEAAVVVEREGAGGQLLAVARPSRAVAVSRRISSSSSVVVIVSAPMHRRHDEAALALHGDAEVDPVELDDLLPLGVEPRVEHRVLRAARRRRTGRCRPAALARVGGRPVLSRSSHSSVASTSTQTVASGISARLRVSAAATALRKPLSGYASLPGAGRVPAQRARAASALHVGPA